ncbi:hypothetical protein D3C75_408140 [compost metagenome]
MKITGNVEVEAVTGVVCDIYRLNPRVTDRGLQFANLQALEGYGTKHVTNSPCTGL